MEKETLLAPGCTVEMLERFYSPRNADVRKALSRRWTFRMAHLSATISCSRVVRRDGTVSGISRTVTTWPRAKRQGR